MDDSKLGSISQIEAFLKSVDGAVTFSLETKGYTNKQKMYEWIGNTLVRLRYDRALKKERGVILSYIETMTHLSRDRLKKLAMRRKKRRKLIVVTAGRNSFPKLYSAFDIARLIETDNVHGRISGDATKEILRREFEVYGKEAYETIANISVSHLYNLRNHSRQYKSAVLFVDKTQATQIQIGRRAKPNTEGKPGYLRVDSVHQGDLDKQKGVYHINLVDEVTQFEIIMCVEGIAEYFLQPALEAALRLFPFRIIGFHSDNGSEYINGRVAELLEKLRIDQTKSRSRRTNDNALVEGKNGSRIRKHMGHVHIPKKYAGAINDFYRDHMDVYLNYHRPCAFPTETMDARGKIKKKYDIFMTPYQKLCSLTQYEWYLADSITPTSLAALAAFESDNENAEKMQKAKTQLFNTFTKC
jgi:transposase InsO family protein